MSAPEHTLGMADAQRHRLHQRLRTAGAVLATLRAATDEDLLVHCAENRATASRALGERLLVGRDPAADWRFDDAQLSRRHFEIVRTPEGLALRDLGSQNGTRINGEPAADRDLVSGDVIQAGGQTFLFLARLAAVP